MTALSQKELTQLAAEDGGWRVSVCLPTHVAGEQNQQASVRYRNLLREARRRLIERGMTEDDADRLLADAGRFSDDREFWRTPANGATILIDANGLRSWSLPAVCPELAVVGHSFFIVPLIATHNAQTPYYLLAISQKRARLLRGVDDELVEVLVPGMPEGGIEALGYDEPEERSQTHTASPRLTGKQSVVFHGQGGAADAAKKELFEYLRLVDRAVVAVIGSDSAPLVVAGVDYLFPIYQQVSSTPRLWPKHLAGNPDFASTQQLAAGAVSLLADLREGRSRADIDRYWMNASGGRTEKHIEQIVREAHAGMVETLFIDPSVLMWGRFDAVTGDVRIDCDRRFDSESLTNQAAVNVLRHGGNVETAAANYVPGGGAMSAILRFSAEAAAGA